MENRTEGRAPDGDSGTERIEHLPFQGDCPLGACPRPPTRTSSPQDWPGPHPQRPQGPLHNPLWTGFAGDARSTLRLPHAVRYSVLFSKLSGLVCCPVSPMASLRQACPGFEQSSALLCPETPRCYPVPASLLLTPITLPGVPENPVFTDQRGTPTA